MTIQERFSAAGAVALGARVAVYVPGTCGVDTNDNALADRMTASTAAALSEMFGGATATDAAGYWVSDAVGLVREAVRIVYSNTTRDELDRRGADVLALAERIKREMAQEAVSVEIDGALYLV